MNSIKIKLEGEEHSAGRGVGFYRSHLQTSLEKIGGIEIVSETPDLVHYPFFDLFYSTLPQNLQFPTVVTIHDLAPLVLSQNYPTGIRAKINLFMQRLALRNVSAVVTDSLCSKKDIVDLFHIEPEKVHVTYLAVDGAYSQKPTEKDLKLVREKYHLPEKFILYVGGVNPNKNLVRLARAAIKLNLPLVFVGSEFSKAPVQTFSFKKLLGFQSVHPEVREFMKLKTIIDHNPLFHVLGFVNNQDLNAIYRLAEIYCQPSLYEGFGLPVLEAMTAGSLVVSSQAGSLPEIYPLETISFSPTDQKDIETSLGKALNLSEKERTNMIEAGREKSKDFSWEKTAIETKRVYLSVLQPK